MAHKEAHYSLGYFEYIGDAGTGYCSGCGTSPMPVGSIYIKGNLKGSGSGGFLVVCPTCRAELKERL